MRKFKIIAALLLVVSLVACDEINPISSSVESSEDSSSVADNTAPILVGISDVTINRGDEFDPREGISAMDNIDGLITSRIEITGEVDVNVDGVHTLTYTVSDNAGNTATLERKITVVYNPVDTLYFPNGDFSLPLGEEWGHWAGSGGASSVYIEEGVLVYDVTNSGMVSYSNQFSQMERTLVNGKSYNVTFKAKADIARSLQISVEDPVNNYEKYHTEEFELTTEWATYSLDIIVTKATSNTIKFGFFLGALTNSANTKVYLDDVVATELNETPLDTKPPVITGVEDFVVELYSVFDPLAGVNAYDVRDISVNKDSINVVGSVDTTKVDEYLLTYSAIDSSNNTITIIRKITVTNEPPVSSFVINNGDFATPIDETTDWKIQLAGAGGVQAGEYTAELVDEALLVHVTKLGTVAHGVQVNQFNKILEQGRNYKVSFKAKADDARSIRVVLENIKPKNLNVDFNITTEWDTYSFEYFNIGETVRNVKFGFFLGTVNAASVPTTIYLDDVLVEALPRPIDVTAPVLTGVDDYIIPVGFSFNPLEHVKVTDDLDYTLTVNKVTVEGSVDTAVENSYTLTYRAKDSAGNETVEERVITVSNTLPASLFVIDNGDFSSPLDPANIVTNWQTKISGSGAYTAQVVDGVLEVDVTALGTVPHGVQINMLSRTVEQWRTYRVTFRAKADADRPIKTVLENASYQRLMDQDVELTTEWKPFTVEFYYGGPTITNAKFAFFTGLVGTTSVTTKVYIDDVTVTVIG